jgi:two-component system NtrC family sensor kinase
MQRFFRDLFSAPFQFALVVAFSLVAAITITIGAVVISGTIDDYLSGAMSDRITRDMRLAQAFYDLKLRELSSTTTLLALNPTVVENLAAASQGQASAKQAIGEQIADQTQPIKPGGNQVIALLDAQGKAVSTGGQDWSALPVVQSALRDRQPIAATEVIPVELLEQVNLAAQARITLIDTPRAALMPFDSREGTAGLALVSVAPVVNGSGQLIGAAFAFYLINNDFALVDQIKNVAGIDTVTVFFGDLRVSTNVMTPDGKRALGTRMSSEVRAVVLDQCCTFTGPAFVVDQNYITRYEPLRDHANQVVGSLYVGAQQLSFVELVNTFNQRIALVAAATMLFTFLLAVPVSRVITRPLKELRELVGASQRVAQGDLTARAPVRAGGEVGLVALSFNTMLDTLQTTQNQLVHTEKLASLGQLAAGVAHELNNPLGTVLLYSDILLRERPEYDQHYADLKMIVSETKRCKRIVGDLLNFARQQQVTAQPTDVHELIRELIDMAPRRVKTVTVNFVTEFDPNLPVIEADTAQLRQAFLNLMTNAVEAMPQGGTLTVHTRAAPPGMITVEIQDTGVGIPADNLSKLFTPFFTTKPIGKGTGLGLAIVYGIIKMHRGQINVRSQPGQGTTFTVTLPVRLFAAGGSPSIS